MNPSRLHPKYAIWWKSGWISFCSEVGLAAFKIMSHLYLKRDWRSKYQQLWEHKLFTVLSIYLSISITQTKAGKSSCHWHLYLCVYLSVCVTVLPDSPNFPYRRYDRLPPISQFSIESDSDLSETAELIEEYEVFDPSRPRPKVILVIGKELEQHSTRMMPDIKIPADSCVTTRQSSKALFVCLLVF